MTEIYSKWLMGLKNSKWIINGILLAVDIKYFIIYPLTKNKLTS